VTSSRAWLCGSYDVGVEDKEVQRNRLFSEIFFLLQNWRRRPDADILVLKIKELFLAYYDGC
jgi:hypothetical protein